jgi:uncharacterized protein (DUF983 family)
MCGYDRRQRRREALPLVLVILVAAVTVAALYWVLG